jgi:excinuclease UvrABC nuclease subunit
MATDDSVTIELVFDGYWRQKKVESVPTHAGVYCVYTCTYNKDAKPKPTVSVNKLVYIGEAGNVRTRLTGHELWDEWEKHLKAGQVLCFSTAALSPEATRQRAEAGLIFKHKPPVNTEYVHSFPFDTTTINASGTTAKLTTSFTVKKGATD